MKQLVLCLIIVLLSSCGTDKNVASKTIIPLRVGNQWFFEMFENGVVTDTLFHIIEGFEKIEMDGQTVDAYKLLFGSLRNSNNNSGVILVNDETGGIIQLGVAYKDNFSPYDDEVWARIYYLSPGIGIVKMEHCINDQLTSETVLYSYRF